MASYNRIIMVGNLTRDPEYKQVTAQPLCRLSLASNRSFRNKQTGAMVQEVCYVDVDVWGSQADNCRQYLQKGRPVLVEGRLKLDTWKDADGSTKRRHCIVAERVVFLGFGQQSEAGSDDISAIPSQSTKDFSGKLDSLNGEALFKDEPPFEDEQLPF